MFVVDMVPLEGLTSAHDYVAVWPVKGRPDKGEAVIPIGRRHC